MVLFWFIFLLIVYFKNYPVAISLRACLNFVFEGETCQFRVLPEILLDSLFAIFMPHSRAMGRKKGERRFRKWQVAGQRMNFKLALI